METRIEAEKLKSDASRYQSDLDKFKGLIETEGTDEQDIQDFLEKHVWLIGFEYLDSQPKKPSQFTFEDSRFDFLLQRFDTDFDIVELKKPSARLFVGSGSTESPSRSTPQASDLSHAISQAIHYLDLMISKREQLRNNGVDITYPRAVIIAGRTRNSEEKKRLGILTAYLHRIEVRSYDEVIDKAKTVISNLMNKEGYTA